MGLSHGTISDWIRGDLTARLRSEHGAPAELTLPSLARHYGVSVTPVREALRALIREGVLVKRQNGRVGVGPNAGTAVVEVKDDAPPSRPEVLEEALATDVIVRSIRGDDDYLREEATAKRFGVGRTAVRQAFGRLAGQGLLVHVPRCGWKVRPFDPADLRAYLDMRETLELKALALARPRLVEADLRRMLAGNVAEAKPPELDNDLHGYLVEKAGNPYLRDFFQRHGAYYTTLFDYAAPETRVVRAMARQHRAVLLALIAKDWKAARRALADHIRAQRPIVEGLLRRIARPENQEDSPR